MNPKNLKRAKEIAEQLPALEEARSILRGILRHEFRHHLEFLGGNHSAASLEAEDERKKQAYLARHADDPAVKAGPDRPNAE